MINCIGFFGKVINFFIWKIVNFCIRWCRDCISKFLLIIGKEIIMELNWLWLCLCLLFFLWWELWWLLCLWILFLVLLFNFSRIFKFSLLWLLVIIFICVGIFLCISVFILVNIVLFVRFVLFSIIRFVVDNWFLNNLCNGDLWFRLGLDLCCVFIVIGFVVNWLEVVVGMFIIVIMAFIVYVFLIFG